MQGHDDAEGAGELAAGLIGGHVLRDLFIQHQLTVNPAGAAAAQDVAQEQERSIVIVEVRNGRPVQIDAVELDAIVELDRHGFEQLSVGHPGTVRLGAADDWPKIAFNLAEGAILIEVADKSQAGVAGHIESAEE